MTHTLEQLQLAGEPIRQAPGSTRRIASSASDDGSAHIEYLDGIYHYVVTERSEELECRMTISADEVMYWLVRDTSFELASAHEVQHRDANQDSGRQLFARQIALLVAANPSWADPLTKEHQEVLQGHPFLD